MAEGQNITDFSDEIAFTSLSQSSSYNNNSVKYGADKAVDGNTDGDLTNGGCIFTGQW